MSFRKTVLATGALAALTLAGCGREADRASRADAQSAATQASDVAASTTRTSYEARASRRQDDGPRAEDGRPQWASNRQRSGEENAQKQFERNGKDFDVASVEAYIAKAHAFVSHPPQGVLSLTRANGDVLYYDPKANVFVVADRQGAPRTMFKPSGGMSYWTQQQDRAAQQDQRSDSGADRPRRRNRTTSDEDSNG